jgi:hypothetical protein
MEREGEVVDESRWAHLTYFLDACPAILLGGPLSKSRSQEENRKAKEKREEGACLLRLESLALSN